MADVSTARKWIFGAVGSALGGGIAGAGAAAFDPGKYRFPQDFGSGKLWPFFFMGFGLTLGGYILRSPWGQKVMTMFQQSQSDLEQSRKDLEKAKADLKDAAKQH
jgi:hypothetical protein